MGKNSTQLTAFEIGAEMRRKPRYAWTKLRYQLPDHGDMVLVTGKNGQHVCFFWNGATGEKRDGTFETFEGIVVHVTHWMLVPDIPDV
jgi:hypothetical protein